MLPRQQAEQDALIGQLRSHDNSVISEQERLVPLVLLKVEKWKLKSEEMFDMGALAVGLHERVLAALNIR